MAVHVHRIPAVAPDLVVGDGRRRGGLQLDAAAGVVQDPVAGDRRRGVVARQDAVAAVVADLVVADRRRGAVHQHAIARAAGVAHDRELQLGQRVHAAVAEDDAGPVATRRTRGCAVAVGVAGHVILDRREDDPLAGSADRAQDAVDLQLLARVELDHHARLDRQLHAGVDGHVVGDDVRAGGQRPGGVAGNRAADRGPDGRRAGGGQRIGQRQRRRSQEAAEGDVVGHRVARAAGVAGDGSGRWRCPTSCRWR